MGVVQSAVVVIAVVMVCVKLIVIHFVWILIYYFLFIITIDMLYESIDATSKYLRIYFLQ